MMTSTVSPLLRFARLLPPRGLRLLALALALVGTGVAITVVSQALSAPIPAYAAPAPASEPLPVVALPAIVVRGQAPIPTLGTVVVRSPAKARIARALPVHAVTSFATTGSAGAGFGMPYYSFGKAPRRGTEE